MSRIQRFARHEHGNATIEIVTLIAGVMFLTLAIVNGISDASMGLADDIGTVAQSLTVD